MSKFWLVNKSGAVVATVEETNFRNARRYFASYFAGAFKVQWKDNYSVNNYRYEKGVRL